jgi:hypothetical protein
LCQHTAIIYSAPLDSILRHNWKTWWQGRIGETGGLVVLARVPGIRYTVCYSIFTWASTTIYSPLFQACAPRVKRTSDFSFFFYFSGGNKATTSASCSSSPTSWLLLLFLISPTYREEEEEGDHISTGVRPLAYSNGEQHTTEREKREKRERKTRCVGWLATAQRHSLWTVRDWNNLRVTMALLGLLLSWKGEEFQ